MPYCCCPRNSRMRSTFVRKSTAGSAADLGTRPGIHGETLISTGLADLDNLLGEGIALGSLVLIFEDAWTPHGSTLLRYFVAEGAAWGHSVMWAGASRPLPSALPQMAKPRQRSSRKDSEEAAEQDTPQLRIAWQYRRYIQRQQVQQQSGLPSLQEDAVMPGIPSLPSGSLGRLTSAPARSGLGRSAPKEWCHQYDLTKPMEESTVKSARLDCQQCRGPEALDSMVAGVQEHVERLGDSASATKVASTSSLRPANLKGSENIGRVAIEALGAAAWHLGIPAPEQSRQLLLALTKIKAIIKAAQCAAVVSIPAGELEGSAVARLELLADAVIAVEAVRDDSGVARMISDGSSCCGLLRIQKLPRELPRASTNAKALPQMDVHVIRHKRRRLAIEVLQVDPEAEAAEAERANKKSSAAGLLCSGPPAANTPLDF